MQIRISDTLIAREAVLPPSIIAEIYRGLTRQLVQRYAAYLNSSLAIANPELRSALYTADGDLRPHIAEDRLRAVSKYLLRAASRTTPYGMFAAVGVRHWANGHDDRAGDDRDIRVYLRPDYEVIAETIALLDAQLHPEIRCVINRCCVRRGDRIYIHSTNDTAMRVSEYGTYEHRYSSASIRVTPAIRRLEARTNWPATVRDLLDDIIAAEQTPEAAVNDVITLVRSRYLIPEYEATPSAQAHEIVQQLLESDGLFFDDQRLDLGANPERVTRLYDACASKFRARTPIAADLIRADVPTVCSSFKSQVSKLARAYVSCARPISLERYRYRFERHVEGTLRAVPLLELIDERRGIGTRDLTSAEGEASFDRARIKRDLLRAIRMQSEELSLTEQDFLEIFVVRADHKVRSLEVAFEMCHALARRNDRLPIAPSAMGGSSGAFRSFGRFSYAFQALSHVSEASNSRDGRAVYADLYYRPSSARSANVAIGPRTSEYQIAIGCFPNRDQQTIDVDDLFVWSDGSRLRLGSKQLQTEIIVRESHLLNPDSAAAPVARLLSLMGRQYDDRIVGVDLSFVDDWPYVPRISVGEVILSPQCWRITVSDASIDHIRSHVDLLKADFGLPNKVVVTNADQRLPVDLGTELGLCLLADQAEKLLGTAPLAIVQLNEDLCLADGLPHYREELVASIFVDGVAEDSADDYALATMPRLLERVTPQARYRTPFTEVCQINLYMGADEQDFLLRDAIPQWIDSFRRSVLKHWFFVRYDDGYPHLRLRVFGDVEHSRELLLETTSFTRALAALGTIDRFAIGTYQPEFERYGGTSMMRAAEVVFSESSDAVTANMRELISDRVIQAIVSLTPYVVAAADLSLLLGRGDLPRIDVPRDLAKKRRAAEEGARDSALYQELMRYLPQFRDAHGAAATRYLWHDLAHMHFNRCGLSRAAENLARQREVATRSRMVQSRCHE